jgi:hypothetical protein
MSIQVESDQKVDLSKLGEFYSPINDFDYESGQISTEPNVQKKILINKTNEKNEKKIKCISNFSPCSPNIIINKNKLKVKFQKVYSKGNDSFIKKTNNSYNISRNENNVNENTTTISTVDDRTNITSSIEEKNKISKLKELMVCFLCHEKVNLPKICPNCYKIACEECLKKWFILYKNYKCFNCKKFVKLEDMIIIPIINNISNLLNKKTYEIKNDSNLFLNKKIKYSKFVKNDNDSNRQNTSCYGIGNLIQNSPKDSIDLKNNAKIIKHRKFPNSISEPRKTQIKRNENEYEFNEFCNIHQDQLLYYYCVNCEKSYCRTCFVFFGEEKNKHNGHKIIDYDKFRNNKNFFDILQEAKNLKEKNETIYFFINQCEYLKICYKYEKDIVNRYVKSFINKYNEQIDENISKLNILINDYKNYIEQINKQRDNIKKYYSFSSNNNYNNNKNNLRELTLLNDINKINNLDYFKDIDTFVNLSPIFIFNIYHTDINNFIIKNKDFRFKIKLNNSKYNLVILNKGKEVQIYIYYQIEKEIKNKKLILPYIYLKKNEKKWEIYELKESLTYNGNYYFIKRFKADNFCDINSNIKIKGILYENFFV